MFPKQVFPETSEIDSNGRLVIGGCNTLDLAEEFGTPVFVIDEVTVRNRFQELEKDFSQNKLSPADLKPAIAEYLVKIIAPIRDKLSLGPDLLDTIQKSA